MHWVRTRLHDRQLKHAYSWRSLLCAGVRVAGGSDAPIESCSPFTGIYDAIMRRARGGDEVFREEERLCFAEALYLYTLGAAAASHSERLLGEGYAQCMHAQLMYSDTSLLAPALKIHSTTIKLAT